MPVLKRRRGTYFVRVGFLDDREGPYPSRQAAFEAKAAIIDKRIAVARRRHSEFTARVDPVLGYRPHLEFQEPYRRHRYVGWFDEALVEIPGLPFVLNRWGIFSTAAAVAVLIYFPEFSPMLVFRDHAAFLLVRNVLAALVLSFGSPFIWRPVGLTISGALRMVLAVGEAVGSFFGKVFGVLGKVLGAVFGVLRIALLIAIAVGVGYYFVNRR